MCNVIVYGPAITPGKTLLLRQNQYITTTERFLTADKPSIHFPKRSSCPVSRINEPVRAQYQPDESSQNLDPLLIAFQHL